MKSAPARCQQHQRWRCVHKGAGAGPTTGHIASHAGQLYRDRADCESGFGWHETGLHVRERLVPSALIDGPALVAERN